MPGYELERFIDLTQIERSELTCSICQDIFRSPVVTVCCQQTFCEECIVGWLSANNTCPYDRKKLKVNNLMRPPRLLVNMLSNLRLYCQFRDKGCEQVLMLESHDSHLTTCPFNKKICQICECESVTDHNCVHSLQQMNSLLKEDINLMQKKNDLLAQKLQKFKDEKESLLETIENLSKYSLRSKNTFKLSDYQMIMDSRRHLETPVVNSRETPPEMINKIVLIVKNAINSVQTINDLCKTIKEKTETQFDSLWQCSALYDHIGAHCFTYDDMFIVSVNFGKLKITVHKVYDDIDIKKLSKLMTTGRVSEELVIEKTDMNEENVVIVKEITINAIKKSNNLTEFAKNTSKELSKRLDGFWQVFAFRTFLANCYVCPKIGRFISLTICDLNVVIFQV